MYSSVAGEPSGVSPLKNLSLDGRSRNCRPGWPVLGSESVSCALWIKVSISHVTDPTTQVAGRTGLGSELPSVMVNCQESMSGLTLRDPGLYLIEKWNLVKNRAHVACWEFRRFPDRMYSRFLWYVQTMKGCSAPSSQCLRSSRAS